MRSKILFILHLPPPIHGAAVVGQYIQNSDIINRQFDTRYVNLGTSSSVNNIGKGGLRKIARYCKLVMKSIVIAIRFSPDIVYMTMTAKGVGFYKDALIVLMLKLLRKKLVFHFHNKGIQNHQHKLVDNWLYRLVFKNSKVILLSESLFPDIVKYVDIKDVFFCPNGILPINLEDEQRTKSIVPEILFIGNLTESKGIYDLLGALKILADNGLQFRCNIIGGEGTLSKNELLEKIDSYSLNEHVKYLGRKIDEEKSGFLATADIFVHPSHEECFPLVILEAMNFGLPVVSTYEGGIPDIVLQSQTGYLVQKHNISSLSERLKELLIDNNLRSCMGQNARKRFLENFTISTFEIRFAEILQNISK